MKSDDQMKGLALNVHYSRILSAFGSPAHRRIFEVQQVQSTQKTDDASLLESCWVASY